MTVTDTYPRQVFPLVEQVRAIEGAPTPAGRKAIRNRARRSQGQIAAAVGLSAQRIWQFENVVETLPLTPAVLRYLDLLRQLDEATRTPNVQK